MNIVSLDDHPIFSIGLREALTARNNTFQVCTLSRASDALNHLMAHPETDLIILDLEMPGMDGLSFMQAMEHRGLCIPVLIMTAKTELSLYKECLAYGAMGILPKTTPIDEVEEALIRITHGELVIPDAITMRLNHASKFAEENTETVLSKRQLEILRMVQSGLRNQDIALVLFISERTVKSHLQTIFRILHARNRVDCVRKAESLGILSKAAVI